VGANRQWLRIRIGDAMFLLLFAVLLEMVLGVAIFAAFGMVTR
jgi:hypothetical protein